MTRTRSVVTVVAAAALVAGVLWVRGGTAAVEADLAGTPAPSPSAAATEEPAGGSITLAANGVQGARLGASGVRTEDVATTPAGCTYAWVVPDPPPSAPAWDVNAWLVDGVVAAVLVTSWDDSRSTSDRVSTWLGPTLGSPIEAASELPGARTVVEQPFGADGPAVTVVTVPGQGVETVYSDVVPWLDGGAGRSHGRVTTVEVRHPGARACELGDGAPLHGGAQNGGAQTDPPALDLDGFGRVRLGSDVDELVDAGLLQEEPGLGPGSEAPADQPCRAFTTVDEPWARVVSVADRVALVQLWGGQGAAAFGVQVGDDVARLQSHFPDLRPEDVEAVVEAGSGDLTVTLGGSTVTLSMWPATVFVADVDRSMQGGPPVLQAVSVADAAVDATDLIC